MAADPIVYCLEHLTDYEQFERLCHDLMHLHGYAMIEPLGQFKDKGRDAIHVGQSNAKKTIFAYSVREDWRTKLEEDCTKILEHGHACDQVAFLCTSGYTATERDRAVEKIETDYGWRLDLYGIERLRTMLTPEVIARHPSIFIPAFFKKIEGVQQHIDRKLIVIDSAKDEEHLTTWLARKLIVAGYQVWCAPLAPVIGKTIAETVTTMIRLHAVAYIPILSNEFVDDPNATARLAIAVNQDGLSVIPIETGEIERGKLDQRTSALSSLQLKNGWASLLARLLESFHAEGFAVQPSGGAQIALESYLPSPVTEAVPERVFSNCFQVRKIPENLRYYGTNKSLSSDDFSELRSIWAFRKVDNSNFIAFAAPPESTSTKYGIEHNGGIAWKNVKSAQGINCSNLVKELIKKTIVVELLRRGLENCRESKQTYFPGGLVKNNRLPVEREGRRKSTVGVCGRRKLWRPNSESYYHYHLAPAINVIEFPELGYVISIRIRYRITDDSGNPYQGRSVTSRRKHLCKGWWNNDWFNRVLAVAQWLSEDSEITVGEDGCQLSIDANPMSSEVGTRIIEGVLKNSEQARSELLEMHRHDDIEEGDSE